MIPIARPLIGAAEREAVDRVLKTGALTSGPEVAAFEAEFSEHAAGGRPCVAVNSGTSALHLGLLASGIGPGDEVIVPSFTFAASANAIALAGATPVFADIDASSFCVSVEAARAAITARTAAIMAVHLFGQPAHLSDLRQLADQHGIALIEDACQAHLARWQGRLAGTHGAMAAFSFYPTKNMTTGEGGMIVLADDDSARRARLLRNQGMEKRYLNEIVGFNARMTDMQAAIGRVQLTRLAEWTIQRQQNAAFYDGAIAGCGLPSVAHGATHVYHQYTVRIPDDHRDAVVSGLAAAGVGTGVYYPIGVHQLPPFAQSADLPETEKATREVLSIPVHPSLSDSEREAVARALNDAVAAVS